jgi:hypothetical protein
VLKGRGRAPHDPECDHAAGLYPEVPTPKEPARTWAGLRRGLSLHCSARRGKWDDLVYLAGMEQVDL